MSLSPPSSTKDSTRGGWGALRLFRSCFLVFGDLILLYLAYFLLSRVCCELHFVHTRPFFRGNDGGRMFFFFFIVCPCGVVSTRFFKGGGHDESNKTWQFFPGVEISLSMPCQLLGKPWRGRSIASITIARSEGAILNADCLGLSRQSIMANEKSTQVLGTGFPFTE